MPEELIKLLLEAARRAPSAFNERSTEFVVINDRKILDEIYKFNPKRTQVKKATVAILVCGNQARRSIKVRGIGSWMGRWPRRTSSSRPTPWAWGRSGPRFIPYPDRIPKVQKLLNLPDEVLPLNIIPIGYPAEKKFREQLYDARPGA